MKADDVIEALNKAAQALASLNGPEDEAHLLDYAGDGIASALGYVRTWRGRAERCARCKHLKHADDCACGCADRGR